MEQGFTVNEVPEAQPELTWEDECRHRWAVDDKRHEEWQAEVDRHEQFRNEARHLRDEDKRSRSIWQPILRACEVVMALGVIAIVILLLVK